MFFAHPFDISVALFCVGNAPIIVETARDIMQTRFSRLDLCSLFVVNRAVRQNPDIVPPPPPLLGAGIMDGAPLAGNRWRLEGNREHSTLSVSQRDFPPFFFPCRRP